MNQSESKEKDLWVKFYKSEKNLFQFIKNNSKALVVNAPPEYRHEDRGFDNLTEIPPLYVRAVYQLNRDEYVPVFQKMLDKMKENYRSALGEKFKNYPIRTAEYYENVSQINISTHDAYESLKIKEDQYFPIFSTSIDQSSIDSTFKAISTTINKFKEMDINARLRKAYARGAVSIEISTNDLFKYSKSNDLQARRKSGRHYRALLRKENERNSTRIKYGLIILSPNSNCEIYTANPQAPRPHSLREIGHEIKFKDLPLILSYKIFAKQS